MKNLDFLKIDARFDSGATRGRNEISAKRKNVSEARRCCWETKKPISRQFHSIKGKNQFYHDSAVSFPF